MVRASGKSSGLLGTVTLATLSNNPDDLNNGIQLMVPHTGFHLMVSYAWLVLGKFLFAMLMVSIWDYNCMIPSG